MCVEMQQRHGLLWQVVVLGAAERCIMDVWTGGVASKLSCPPRGSRGGAIWEWMCSRHEAGAGGVVEMLAMVEEETG